MAVRLVHGKYKERARKEVNKRAIGAKSGTILFQELSDSRLAERPGVPKYPEKGLHRT
jgi:hypothetical protein